MSNEDLRNRREKQYEITVYGDRSVEEFGGLNPHSELEELCRRMAQYFRDNKYKGRLDIMVTLR